MCSLVEIVFLCAMRNSGLDIRCVVEAYVVMACSVWVTGQKPSQENLQTDVAAQTPHVLVWGFYLLGVVISVRSDV